VHLESSPDATTLRLTQLDIVLPSLLGAPHAVLMGDFNFDPAQQAEQSRVEERYLDLWNALRGDAPGYTEDTDVNRMRLIHKGKEKRARYDRILLHSMSPGWVPSVIRRIGTEPISNEHPEIFPSDHFGLAGTLEWKGPGHDRDFS
jgi:tyrosyl-DNA phosphodiesterase 2